MTSFRNEMGVTALERENETRAMPVNRHGAHRLTVAAKVRENMGYTWLRPTILDEKQAATLQLNRGRKDFESSAGPTGRDMGKVRGALARIILFFIFWCFRVFLCFRLY